MKVKLPSIQLQQLVPYALAIAAMGFLLIQTDTLMEIGAVLFSLGLLPASIVLSRYKD
mgnify:FL=1|jgi:Na+/phosphate symporter